MSGSACNTRTLGQRVVCICEGRGSVNAMEVSEGERVAPT
jgi:hypothetical protein